MTKTLLKFARWLISLTLGLVCAVQAANHNGTLLADANLNLDQLIQTPVEQLPVSAEQIQLSGGHYWFVTQTTIDSEQQWVIDFSSSTVVANFSHFIVDSNDQIVGTLSGGLRSTEINPFLLRHGRMLDLEVGHYRIFTRVESPFFLAQIQPALHPLEHYQQSIKLGNVITLVGLGIFFSLGLYYFVLGLMRKNRENLLYFVFIMANFLFNGTALNAFNDVLNLTVLYSIGFPIMLSNIAYIGFVMALLGITKKSSPILHRTGLIVVAVLVSFWPFALIMPNLSLEFARYGVVIFSLYGISSGIYYAIKGKKIARYYLIANIAFIIPAFTAIGLQSMSDSSLVIEHIGLLAVAIEVMLLSLVISYQINVNDKERAISLRTTREALIVADQAVKAKERFLANISHELRTPLNAIQGSVELVSESKLDEQSRRYLGIIQHSSAFLLFLINDILDLAKAKAGKLRIEHRPLLIRQLITNITRVYSQGLTLKNDVQFLLTIDPDVPETIVSDENRIEQVLANLLSNAFKFTQQGSVHLHLEVLDDGKTLRMSVTDSGIGIAQDKLSSIFHDFTQGDTSVSRKYGGTGLGLPIAARIATIMGGKVGAHNNTNGGACFWFTLPLQIPDQAIAEQADTASTIAGQSYSTLRVALVDDNIVNLKIAQAQLKNLHCQVHSFGNALMALDYISMDSIDLVIMDVQMPELDGLEATRRLRQHGFSKPVIAFTANASDADLRQCYTAGMDDVLIKPIKQQHLNSILEKWASR